MAKDIILDFTRDTFGGDGAGGKKRRKKKHWSGADKQQARNQLQRIGFTPHEINLWIAEEVPLGSRVGQNLLYARRKLMKGWMSEGKTFQEARRLASQDRVDSTVDANPGWSKTKADDYIWGLLYTLSPRERKISGPAVRLR